ncbi:MAG: hypothetical protein J5J06_05345 [Phycisphaerae bacterium]|nr:hypothetical protein [Phycisphaerae bacterium]
MKKIFCAVMACGLLAAVAVSPALAQDRVSATEKGSILLYPKVEIRWDAAGNVIQDTFIDITNDFPEDVFVQMHFVNGDEALDYDCYYDHNCEASLGVGNENCRVCERPHLGWNWVDVKIELTGNEPTYWSAYTGLPKGVSPFTILDPGYPPGRPDPDGSGNRVLRGFVIAWAVNNVGEEIRWNHLKGDALLVNYMNGSAWEYNAYAFGALVPETNGGLIPGTGELLLDGQEYEAVFAELLLDFYAVGSTAFSGAGRTVEVDTDLTLMPMDIDLRQENEGPTTTKAFFTIWNMNEFKFSGTERCITCWDQTLLRFYDAPNHFLLQNLQTNKGKARIDGIRSAVVCDDPENGIVSKATALLGVSMKYLRFDAGVDYAQAGSNLVGLGVESATIYADVTSNPNQERGTDGLSEVKVDRGGVDRLSR